MRARGRAPTLESMPRYVVESFPTVLDIPAGLEGAQLCRGTRAQRMATNDMTG
jgi:hypothetical protein